MPVKTGDRVKTDRRDAEAGTLLPGWGAATRQLHGRRRPPIGALDAGDPDR